MSLFGPTLGVGVSTGGNTLGSSGIVNQQAVLVGGSNVTLSQSISGQSATVTILGMNGAALAAGTQSANTGTISFANSNGVVFGMSGSNQITASYTQSGQAASGSNGSSTFQTLSFANANGASFYTSNDGLRMSYTTPVQTVQPVSFTLTGNQAGNSTITGNQIYISGGPNITVSGTNNTLVISGGAGAAGNTGYISAGTQTASLGTVSLANSNGISFGLNNQTLTASYTVPTQTVQSYNILAAGTQTANTSGSVAFVDSNGITFGMSNNSRITASHNGITSQTVQTQSNIQGVAGSGASTAYTGVIQFANSNNVTFGLNGNTITASANAAGAGDGYNIIAAGTQTANTSGTVAFLNSNNVTFGMSNSSQVTASIPAGATATGNFGALGAGTQTATSGTVAFSNSNGITFGMSGSNQITASHNGLTSQSVQTQSNVQGIAGSNASTVYNGVVQFANSNGLTFGLNASTITGSYSQQATTDAATAVHLEGNTAGNSSAPFNGQALHLVGGNNITLSGNGSSVTISAAAGGAGGGATAAHLEGNTAGNSSVAIDAASALHFYGGANVTLSGNGSTVTISAAAGGGAAPTLVWHDNMAHVTTVQAPGQGSLYIHPLEIDGGLFHGNMTAHTVFMDVSFSSNASMSAARTYTINMGLYVISASHTLSLVNSFSTSLTNGATSNASASWHGARWISFAASQLSGGNIQLTETNYFVGVVVSTSGSSMPMSIIGGRAVGSGGRYGTAGVSSAASANSYQWTPFAGTYSAATSAMPASIHRNQINASAGAFGPHLIFNASNGISNTF